MAEKIYPWKEVETTVKPKWRDLTVTCDSAVDGCSINIVSGLRNDPDACTNEHFIHVKFMNVKGELYEEIILGPYLTPQLQVLLKTFANVKEAYYFNR